MLLEAPSGFKASGAPLHLDQGQRRLVSDGFVRLSPNVAYPLQYALSTQGPVVVSADASNWETYGGGIFDGCGRNAAVNHAVLAVGYGRSPQGKYWIIRNSWGREWGESGHMRLLRFEDAVDDRLKKRGRGWPKLVIFLRVFHGSFTDLDEIFLPSFYRFWPRREFWRSALSITGTIPDCLFTSNGFGVSELALHPSEDRPSNYGYIQQAHSYLEADLRIYEKRPLLLEMLQVPDLKDLYLLLADADMAFTTFIHPVLLFDRPFFDNSSTARGPVPRVHGVWGRRAEGSITEEAMFRSTVPVADFMDQPPWIFRARDLPELRARVTQGVFSNLHRFFVSAYTKERMLAGDPPVALLRWRSRSSPSWRRWILRFHSNRSAELPFAEMQIAWIDPKDQNVTAEASVAYETFTWSTAMGVVWRCAHPYQLHSLHDRSAAHINILFNNLFWQTGAGADGTYRWLFRRPAFEVDPEERDVMGGAVTLDHLRSYHITAKLGEHLFQSFPLSRYHVELLRRHDLASTESVRELLSALGHSTPCLDHPHGFKVMKHWNSLKTKRHFADHNQSLRDRMMPNSRHTQWQMCLYDFFINTSQGEAGSMDVPGLELCDEMLAAHCSGATFLDLRKECWEKTWECFLWRLILLLNQHIDNNPFLSSSCRLLYRPGLDLSQDQSYLSSGERMEIENQRRPACQAAEQSILAREHLDGSSLGLSFNYYQVLASTCEIFDLGHLLQCHLEQLQVLQSDLLSSAWSHLRP
eukprot:g1467.t1